VREHPLGGLSADAGATLLQKLGVEGDIELMKKLVTDVRGHALTLTVLGSFLKRAYGGNIAKRDQVKLEKADATVQGGHAFRAMEAYEQWLLQGGDEGLREVAILRLMGLFDRPADAVSIQKLRSAIVRDFNEPLVGLSNEDLSLSLFTLEEAHLLTVNRQESGEPKSIDAHPLLREYFAGKIPRATRKRAEALLAKGGGGDAEHGDDNAQTSEARPQRDLVFISYNETDRSSRDIVRKVLESDPDIRSRVWDYNDIPGGSDVPKEIARHLAQAKVIVMITSPAYVGPTSGARHSEIDSALEARERNEMDILWIPAKSYKFETPPVGHIMAATGPNPVPLENLWGEKRDNALLSLLSAVRRSLGLPLPTTSDREKNEGVEEPHDRLQNALSLSGGGFRATFFHLGVLAFHFRRGALGKLNIITAVSGGSILAAHAVLHWETLKQDEAGFRTVMAKLATLARSNVRDRILVRWLWSVGTGWRLLGTAATRLARSRTGRLVRAYRDFYGEQPLQNLQQADRPWLALVATDLYNSSRVYFSHDGMRRISIADGAKQEPFPQKIELDIAFAVAASSSFPPVFRPLVLDYNVLKVRWDTFKLRLHLQDGGVHDNLGLRALQYIAPPENVALGTIHASYAVNPGDIREPVTGLLADRLRALHLFTQGEQAEIANDIATLAGAKPLITKLGHYVPADQPHLLDTATQTALMSFRTDLDAPTWHELYALMAHGYQVAAMHCEYLDVQDLREARSLFCAILAESLAEENGSTPRQEMPSIEKIVSDLSAEQLHRCGARPKGRVAFHLVLYLLLLFTVAFSANRYGSSIIAACIYHFSNLSDPRLQAKNKGVITRHIANNGRAYRLPANAEVEVDDILFASPTAGNEMITIACGGPNAIYYHTEGNPPGFGDNDNGGISPGHTFVFKITAAAFSIPKLYLFAPHGQTDCAVFYGPINLANFDPSSPDKIIDFIKRVFLTPGHSGTPADGRLSPSPSATVVVTPSPIPSPSSHAAQVTTTITGTFSQGTDVSGFFLAPGSDLTGKSYTLVYEMDDTQGVPIYGTWPADCNNGLQNSGLNTPVPRAVLTVNGKSYTFGTYPTTSISSYVYSINATVPQTQLSARIFQSRFFSADVSLWGSETAAVNIYLNSIYKCRSWKSAFPGGTMGSYTLVPGKDTCDGLVSVEYSNLNSGVTIVDFVGYLNVATVNVR
jgi:predicted acylesterase/phospholipase RssA